MKNRLVELIKGATAEANKYINENMREVIDKDFRFASKEDIDWEKVNKIEADYLLANDVIVPPCKVGEIVWIKDYERYPKIQEAEIIGIIKNKYGTFIRYEYLAFRGREYVRSIEYIGKTVFLTKEEAEQALVTDKNVGSKKERGAEFDNTP